MLNLEVKDAILINNQKTRSEMKKGLEDSIANGNKNKNTDTEQKIVQRAKKMRQKLFTNLKKLLRTKKSDIV